ncbi:response regulator [Plasticicumulans sp.]|uniref:response regulator n=1 Tax=Plasticicumulans sp. TaxID=2307179 RepID=UPI002CBC69CD|nr:response regulator [Plasticicumulans sp.]MBS0601411.1 response regulator [Pseudomonadota bacterium]HMV39036.1 response regulator [Plasticicumulans sp.]HMW30726.1 response regulator [Plasticicumulans sp.]HMZ09670.1 response regulator [Plasticicumulans sp.]HNB91126.1 response regulator [Plasticicumulans sp.]
MIRVMLVDDHQLIRIALGQILGGHADIEVVAEAADGEEALVRARAAKPDVILIDVDMPGMGGVEATRRLSALAHKPRVVAISVHDQMPYPQRMMEAGAVGYLPKGGSADEVLAAVRAVARGQPYIAPVIAGKMFLTSMNRSGSAGNGAQVLDTLSAREMQVMLALVNGQNPQQIGEALKISAKTVCTHRYHIYEKLGVDSDVALTHLAYRYGLIEVSQS